jgi:hypothetical protein
MPEAQKGLKGRRTEWRPARSSTPLGLLAPCAFHPACLAMGACSSQSGTAQLGGRAAQERQAVLGTQAPSTLRKTCARVKGVSAPSKRSRSASHAPTTGRTITRKEDGRIELPTALKTFQPRARRRSVPRAQRRRRFSMRAGRARPPARKTGLDREVE